MISRLESPAIVNPVDMEVKLPPCEKAQLSNGVEVYAVNTGSEDTMMFSWVFKAGNWFEDRKMTAPAANFLLKSGTPRHSSFEINEHFEFYGASLSRTCYSETAELTLHGLSRHIGELLPMVAELIMESFYPQEELSIYSQNSQQRLRVGLKKSDFVASRLIDANLFGEQHPYGRYSRLEDYAAIRREDLLDFFDKYYRHGRCIIFAAGKLPEGWFGLVDRYFGQLPLRPFGSFLDEANFPIQAAAEKKSLISNDPNGIQAAIRMARPFPNRHHPDFQKSVVLNTIFGGYFGSRLMANIREDKGYTYGIYSYMLNQIKESGWMISTEAGRDVGAATIEEIYREMEALREEMVDEEELLMTRNYMIGSILGDLDGPFQVIARWKGLILNGLAEEYFYKGLETIRTVTAVELQELANHYLQPDDFYELVVV